MPAPTRIDIRQPGGGIDPDMEDDAILTNPHTAYFPGVAPAGGYGYPRYGSAICYVSAQEHIDYGGSLYDDQLRELIVKHMASGEYPLIRLEGAPDWVSITPQDSSIELRWYPEEPSTTFNLYTSLYKDQGFTLLEGGIAQAPGDANNTKLIENLTSGMTHFYYLTAVVGGNEGPRSKVYGTRVL